MKRTAIVFYFIILNLVSFVNAQVVIPADKELLLNGDAAGQNLIAENNGFPSPQRILALKDDLGLMKDQLRKINEMMTNFPLSVTVKGQEIIEAEEELNKMFESGNINEKTLRAKLERIGKLRAELRFSHLQIYLKTKQILSLNQWDRFKELQAGEVK